MELRELRSLVLLAESESITRAAEKLHVSAAAVHNQLKMLEREIGVPLYQRAGRRLKLTQAAETLLPLVRAFLAQYDEIQRSVADLKEQKRGFLRIGTGPTFSSYILPLMLQEYSHRYPDIEVYVDAGHSHQLFDALSQEQLDLVILVLSELSVAPDFMIRATWDFEVVLVTGPGQHRRCSPLSALHDLPFILYKKGSFFENLIDDYFAANDFRPRVTMRFDNAEAIKAMIRSGLGVSMLPIWTVDAELNNKTLSLIRQQQPPLHAKVALVTHKTKRLPQPVETFIEIARSGQWRNKRLMSSIHLKG